MRQEIKWKHNQRAAEKGSKASVIMFNQEETGRIRGFHQTFPQYQPTPLWRLNNLAKYLGVAGIYVKDESYRFGLNAFKVLGGSYAIGKYLAGRMGMSIEDLSFERLKSPEIKAKLGVITFATATDGNHGRGVAWAARQLGHHAVVYMPKGSSPVRLNNIKATGAEAYITDLNYDDTVRMAAEEARKLGRIIIQDTAWEGYEEIPTWIMQGYATMVDEAWEQLEQNGVDKPTHIFAQAGVGSLPATIQGYFASRYGDHRPGMVIVEPDKADCFYQSALAGDGKPRIVTGNMDTIMAGLACGEPNPIAWPILWDYSEVFISCPDYTAAFGMRMLGNPLGDDQKVVSGESGAVNAGLLSEIMVQQDMKELRDKLNLNKDSIVLLFSTEGDTDPDHYRKILWEGLYPKQA